MLRGDYNGHNIGTTCVERMWWDEDELKYKYMPSFLYMNMPAIFFPRMQLQLAERSWLNSFLVFLNFTCNNWAQLSIFSSLCFTITWNPWAIGSGPSCSKDTQRYLLDKSLSSGWRNWFSYTYPLDSDLSSRWRYPAFEQPGIQNSYWSCHV